MSYKKRTEFIKDQTTPINPGNTNIETEPQSISFAYLIILMGTVLAPQNFRTKRK